MDTNQFKAYAKSIFSNYETRMWKKEKAVFLDHSQSAFKQLGYDEMTILEQRNLFGVKSRNLLVGSADADILITAHYDTPGHTGLMMLFSPILGSALGSMLFLVLILLPDHISAIPNWVSLVTFVISLYITITFFIKNKHNHNDNTSGVIGVYAMAELIANDQELRRRCAFVLFDHEEILPGLLGSRAFAKWRKMTYPDKEDGVVINLDCIGVGNILTVMTKKNHPGWHQIADFMAQSGYDTRKVKGSLFGTSDHAVFKNGVSLLFQKRSLLGPLYIPNVHTRRDKVCNLDEIGRLTETVCNYVKTI